MVSIVMEFKVYSKDEFRSGVEYGKGRLNVCLVCLAASLVSAFTAYRNMLARLPLFMRAGYVMPAVH